MNKKLNLFDLTSLGVGTIIGAGVFSMMGYGIAYTGRGIVFALFLAMFLVVMQSIRYPILASVFDVEGGMYGLNSLTNPRIFAGFNAASDMLFKIGSQSVTALAISQYILVLAPGLEQYSKVVAVLCLTIGYIIAINGDKFAAQVQNIMVLLMYIALGIFVVYGFMNMDASAYAGEPMFPNGMGGLIMAIALMSYTCNGFQYVINMGKASKNPKRNIPLAFFLSALIAACIYALIGFAATHAFPYASIAGKNLGDVAKMMMPTGLHTFFIVGGALFALSTSLLGGISSGYRPIQASARDGWFPAGLAKESKRGTPYVFALLYILGLVPILFGLELSDLVTMSLIPSGLLVAVANFSAMNVPTRFANEWAESGNKMSAGLYRVLMVSSTIASIILVTYCFISNSLKVATIIITAIIFIYSFMRSKSDKVNIQVQTEFAANDEK